MLQRWRVFLLGVSITLLAVGTWADYEWYKNMNAASGCFGSRCADLSRYGYRLELTKQLSWVLGFLGVAWVGIAINLTRRANP